MHSILPRIFSCTDTVYSYLCSQYTLLYPIFPPVLLIQYFSSLLVILCSLLPVFPPRVIPPFPTPSIYSHLYSCTGIPLFHSFSIIFCTGIPIPLLYSQYSRSLAVSPFLCVRYFLLYWRLLSLLLVSPSVLVCPSPYFYIVILLSCT